MPTITINTTQLVESLAEVPVTHCFVPAPVVTSQKDLYAAYQQGEKKVVSQYLFYRSMIAAFGLPKGLDAKRDPGYYLQYNKQITN